MCDQREWILAEIEQCRKILRQAQEDPEDWEEDPGYLQDVRDRVASLQKKLQGD